MYLVYTYSTNTTTVVSMLLNHHPYLILHFYETIFILAAATCTSFAKILMLIICTHAHNSAHTTCNCCIHWVVVLFIQTPEADVAIIMPEILC